MNLACFYDTETSGLPLFKQPSGDPAQPHIVQLGACLVDLGTRKTISTLDVIIKPDGWFIPDEVAAIHGITTELASDVGVPESLAVEMLLDMCTGRMRIAHNEQFDARIVRIACKRNFDEVVTDEWSNAADAGLTACTMRLADPIMMLPPTDRMRRAGFTKSKQPNLGEAVAFFTGQPLLNAHSALADVQGCMAVWFAIQDRFPATQRAAA